MKKTLGIWLLLIFPILAYSQDVAIDDVREGSDGSLYVKLSNGTRETISMGKSRTLGGWCGKAVVIIIDYGRNKELAVYTWKKANNALVKSSNFGLCDECIVKAVTQSGITVRRPSGDNVKYSFDGSKI